MFERNSVGSQWLVKVSHGGPITIFHSLSRTGGTVESPMLYSINNRKYSLLDKNGSLHEINCT